MLTPDFIITPISLETTPKRAKRRNYFGKKEKLQNGAILVKHVFINPVICNLPYVEVHP